MCSEDECKIQLGYIPYLIPYFYSKRKNPLWDIEHRDVNEFRDEYFKLCYENKENIDDTQMFLIAMDQKQKNNEEKTQWYGIFLTVSLFRDQGVRCFLNEEWKSYIKNGHNWYIDKCYETFSRPLTFDLYHIQRFLTQSSFFEHDAIDFFLQFYVGHDEAMIRQIYPFVPNILIPLFDLLLYYEHCKKLLNLDILAAWHILDSHYSRNEQNEICAHEIKCAQCGICVHGSVKSICRNCGHDNIKKCLNSRIVIKNLTKHLNVILNDLHNWTRKYPSFDRNHYWNRFGFKIQLQFANQKAIIENDRIVNEMQLIKQIKKTTRRQRKLIMLKCSKIIISAENHAHDANASALRANQAVCSIILKNISLTVKSARQAARLSNISARNANKAACSIIVKLASDSAQRAMEFAHNAEVSSLKTFETIAILNKHSLNQIVLRAENASSTAQLYALSASSSQKVAHDAVLKIRRTHVVDKRITHLISMCHFERLLLSFCSTMIVFISYITKRERMATKLDKMEDAAFQTRYDQLTIALNFVSAFPSCFAKIQQSDFGTLTTGPHRHEPFTLVCQYIDTEENDFDEFLSVNKSYLMEESRKQCGVIYSLAYFVQVGMLSHWLRFVPDKNADHISYVFALLLGSVARFSSCFQKLNLLVDERQVYLSVYQKDISNGFFKSSAYQDIFEKWILQHNIPKCFFANTQHIQLTATCWVKNNCSRDATLFDVLNGQHVNFENVTDRLVFTGITRGLYEFRFHAKLFKIMAHILELIPSHPSCMYSVRNKMQLLTHANQVTYLNLIFEQFPRMLISPSDNLIPIFYEYLEMEEQLPKTIVVPLLHFILVGLQDNILTLLKDKMNRIQTNLLCYISKIAKQLDAVMEALVASDDEVAIQAVLFIWDSNDPFVAPDDEFVSWTTKFKIPLGFQSMDKLVITKKMNDWIAEGGVGDVVAALNKNC